jgi:(2Fe-2S) ferredoxin
LIEKQKQLSFDSIRFMAETVSGSFSFAILDDRNSIWLVKGDNPLSILHFPEKKMYVYASTDAILYKAVVDSMLFTDLKQGRFSEVPIDDGTILKIKPDGTLEKETFHFYESAGFAWWEYGGYPVKNVRHEDEYLDNLRMMAWYQGIDAEEVDALIEEGLTPEEVEMYLYEEI